MSDQTPAPSGSSTEPLAEPAAESTTQLQQRQRASQLAQALRNELQKAVIGQNAVIDDVLTALIGGGHVLLEGVPGLGKTLLVRALASCIGCEFARIQFTPDLMPSDVTGHAVYDLQTEQFKLRKGPLFTNLLLADEINRAPAKTQAALLEAMQERQVTLEGRALPIPQPFMVLATQNPIEWYDPRRLDTTFGGIMGRYTEQAKLAAVQEYCAGKAGLRDVAHRHDVDFSCLRQWVAAYQIHGVAGLQEKK
ncbi:AAA family ATPase, partial [Pseudomonas syringae pv. aptata]|uniref:AAA family ATPase n=1 Tax=Pseudomonas syringae TaxID=317 RepID=UPI001FFC456C